MSTIASPPVGFYSVNVRDGNRSGVTLSWNRKDALIRVTPDQAQWSSRSIESSGTLTGSGLRWLLDQVHECSDILRPSDENGDAWHRWTTNQSADETEPPGCSSTKMSFDVSTGECTIEVVGKNPVYVASVIVPTGKFLDAVASLMKVLEEAHS